MKSFSFSDMNRQSGEILETALSGPVTLTKRGKEKLVILPAPRYRQLLSEKIVEAHTVEAAPTEVHDELMRGLDELLTQHPGDA